MKPVYIIRFEKDPKIVGYRRIVSIAVGPGPQDRVNKEKAAEEWRKVKPSVRKWTFGNEDADIKMDNSGKVKKLTKEEKDALNPPPDPTPIELLEEKMHILEASVGELMVRIEELEKPNG